MKNLDIEKLERSNVYKIPENFFEEMQAKVLTEIMPVKKGRMISMNWAYSAAAAIAIIFGVTFFVNNDGVEKNIQNPIANVESTSVNEIISGNNTIIGEENLVKQNEIILENSKVIKPVEGNKVRSNPVAVVSQVKKYTPESSKVVIESAEIPMDQILSSFTSADLADLGRNTEQDIYLDLYN